MRMMFQTNVRIEKGSTPANKMILCMLCAFMIVRIDEGMGWRS